MAICTYPFWVKAAKYRFSFIDLIGSYRVNIIFSGKDIFIDITRNSIGRNIRYASPAAAGFFSENPVTGCCGQFIPTHANTALSIIFRRF